MSNKSIVKLTGTLLLASTMILSACGNNGNSNQTVKANTEPAATEGAGNAVPATERPTGTLKVQLVGDFSLEDKTDPISGQTSKGVKMLKEEFEKQYPDTSVEFVLMGWDNYNEKTQTMLQSGAADVYQVPGITTFVEQGLLEPLQPYIDKDSYDLGKYLNGQVEGWKVMGPDDQEPQIYGLPFIGDARVIVYDRQLFDDWGVDYLSESPTIEEVLDKASKMTGKNPKTGEQNYGLTFKGSDAADSVMNINESLGGQWGTGFLWKDMKLEFNSDTMVKSLDLMKQATKYAPEGVMAGQGAENFLTEKNNIAINLRESPGFINNLANLGLEDRYEAALLFKNLKTGMGGMFAGSPFAIGASSSNKDLAWEWLKFSGSEFFQQYMWDEQRSQSMPVIKAAENWSSVQEIGQMDIILKQMGQLWTPRYPYRSGQPRYILSENVERVLLGELSSADALKKAQEEATKWLAGQQ
ncbi:extracellular solute-binding protein [Paenibacillus tritici]|uniref:extracellular solute-binding protein n=1 Tax=Paenibacillus tritici TaxID=1873425 RepID=UPI001BA561B9|nr:extracellular solute-binding protein [Paenibacillus tritici]QUL52173.1 extracellular solute-binding protein [Paenibacillus tritici]